MLHTSSTTLSAFTITKFILFIIFHMTSNTAYCEIITEGEKRTLEKDKKVYSSPMAKISSDFVKFLEKSVIKIIEENNKQYASKTKIGRDFISISDQEISDKEQVYCGQTAEVYLYGYMTESNLVFHSNTEIIPIKLGSHMISKGLDIGIEGMRIGGKRYVKIEPEMGISKKLHRIFNPNKKNIMYYIVLHDIQKKEISRALSELILDNPKGGRGEIALCGDEVEAEFTINSVTDPKNPLKQIQKTVKTKIGSFSVPAGIEIGLIDMKVDDSRKVFLPKDTLFSEEIENDMRNQFPDGAIAKIKLNKVNIVNPALD